MNHNILANEKPAANIGKKRFHLGKCFNNGIKYMTSLQFIVLFHSILPTGVIMGMGHHENLQFLGIPLVPFIRNIPSLRPRSTFHIQKLNLIIQVLGRDVNTSRQDRVIPEISQCRFPVNVLPIARCAGFEVRSDGPGDSKPKENEEEYEEGKQEADREEISKEEILDSDMSSSLPHQSESTPQIYCRKDKSLGLLCSNFLKLYNHDGVGMIGLDDAAARLGVQRRRMYDVVNILESVGIVARKAKNQYSWKGFGEIPRALNVLKEESLREKFDAAYRSSADASKNKENGGLESDSEDNPLTSSKTDSCRRDKSLALLTEKFIKLFLCSDVDVILLEDAAKNMPGDAQNSTALRTKVRRLYDIANVLSSINLIEKTNHPENRKTAYRWLGGKASRGSEDTLHQRASKKRVFGAEITNSSLKRSRTDPLMDSQLHNENKPVYENQVGSENVNMGKTLEHPPKSNSKAIDFGPFAPSKLRRDDPEHRPMRQVHDMENMISKHRPEYHNQALSELFGHYVDAWKSWYVEAGAQQQTS
ncbi:E2F transcription factor-like E2FF [Senna tora]|uniref:E2F transcription factor-like E2FF n=1 Tax=Senna tora TaxID=362788 RepID=A0A834TD76_9FABA|nr:E2F transcription factor-like E2FF [Senna tora]